MATKLYFHDLANDQAGTYPTGEQSAQTAEATWTDANTLRTMNTTIGTSQVSTALAISRSTANREEFIRFFTSPPLDGAQTVGGGTATLDVADSESNTAANFWIDSINIYVWRPSTGAKVGTLVDAVDLGGTEPTGANSEQVTTFTFATSAISAADGDVVICEIWADFTQGMSATYTLTFFYDGTTENTTENAVVSNHASFLNLAETLTFQAPSGPAEVSATDSLAVIAPDATAVLAQFDGAESLAVPALEATSAAFVIDASDTLRIFFEVATGPVTEVSTSEIIGVSAQDAFGDMLLLLEPQDSLQVASTETPDSLDVRLLAQETFVQGLTDALGSLLASLDPTDSLRVASGEDIAFTIILSTGETIAVAIDPETGDAIATATLSAVETLAAALEEGSVEVLAVVSDPETVKAGLTDTLGNALATLEVAESQSVGLVDGIVEILASFSDADSLRVLLDPENAEATSPPVILEAAESLAVSLLEVLGTIAVQVEPQESAQLGMAESVTTEAFLSPSETAALGFQENIEARAEFDAAESLAVPLQDAQAAALSLLEAAESLRIALTEFAEATEEIGGETVEVSATESLRAALIEVADSLADVAEALHPLTQACARHRQDDVTKIVSRIANRLQLRIAGVGSLVGRGALEDLAKDISREATEQSGGKTKRLTRFEGASIAAVRERAEALYGKDEQWVKDLRGPREE